MRDDLSFRGKQYLLHDLAGLNRPDPLTIPDRVAKAVARLNDHSTQLALALDDGEPYLPRSISSVIYDGLELARFAAGLLADLKAVNASDLHHAAIQNRAERAETCIEDIEGALARFKERGGR